MRWPPMPRLLWENAPGNLCVDIELGDETATRRRFSPAPAHVVRLSTWVQRVTGVPMEPRTQHRRIQPGERRVHALYGQRPRAVAKVAARPSPRLLGVPAERGARSVQGYGRQFSARAILFYPEYALLAWGRHAESAGRSKWTCERSESFLSDYQGARPDGRGRDGARRSGQFSLAVRGSNLSKPWRACRRFRGRCRRGSA